MIKKTLYGKEARQKILAGVNKISDAVSVTLGSHGRNVLISTADVIDYGIKNYPLHITKDGVTTAKNFDVDDPFEKVGVLAVKEAAEKTVMQAGDGTTTTVVLLRAIIKEGIRLIDEEGANPMLLKAEIDKTVENIVEQLKQMAIPVKGDAEKIRQIATVSANNDSGIGSLIVQAFEKIGEEGIIQVDPSQSVKTTIKLGDGYKFNKGWLSPLFINNKERQTCEFENAWLLLYDKRITHHTQFEKALRLSIQNDRNPLVIICEDADQEGLAILAMNNLKGAIRCCVVTAPEFGDVRRESMEDIATLTGGTFMADIRGLSISKDIEIEHFGKAEKVVISKDETVIIGGGGDKEKIADLLDELRMNLVQTKNEEEKYPIEKRIAKLTGGVAVIQVGGATETEMKEKVDRFDDAVGATKAAIAEGYVLGGGAAFVSMYQKGDVGIINSVLKEPFNQICKNAGVDASDLFEKVWSEKKILNAGYNAKTGNIENLIEAGIIDPVKVLRCAIQNAASAAGMILTAECIICDTF